MIETQSDTVNNVTANYLGLSYASPTEVCKIVVYSQELVSNTAPLQTPADWFNKIAELKHELNRMRSVEASTPAYQGFITIAADELQGNIYKLEAMAPVEAA